MAGRDYALDLDAVTEITAVPPRWTTLPGGGAAALGVVEHRGRLLPLLSLRGLLGLPPAGVQAAARIVVIQRGGQEAGLVVDMVTQVLRVPQSAFDPVPPVLTRGAAGAQVDAICRLDGGRRLVAHLDTARLLDAAMLAGLHDATAPASPGAGVMPAGADRAELAGLDGERFVAVRVGGAEYGLPIAAVDEVVRHPGRLTQVPHAPDFVEGVMNLRGAILPVIDQHQRFGAGRPAPPGPNRRIVVTHFGTTQAGFAVDSASALRVIPRAAIRSAPAVTAGRSAVFDRMATDLDGGVMLLIDPRILLSDTEARSPGGLRCMIKLLVVDDSALMRRLLGGIFTAEGDFELAFARDGREALDILHAFKPDVVTLDVTMPHMDGLACLDRIMLERPSPVVMLSTLTEAGAETTLEAMRLGAVDFVAKPAGAVSLAIGELTPHLVATVRAAAKARLRRSLRLAERVRLQAERGAMPGARLGAAPRPAEAAAPPPPSLGQPGGVLLVGSSTGGPPALDTLLSALPAQFPWPVLIAQHMPAAFTGPLARRLDRLCSLTVSEVTRPQPLVAGQGLYRPGQRGHRGGGAAGGAGGDGRTGLGRASLASQRRPPGDDRHRRARRSPPGRRADDGHGR